MEAAFFEFLFEKIRNDFLRNTSYLNGQKRATIKAGEIRWHIASTPYYLIR
ncbi:hypothetical protein SD78_4297 [Bacillus badius]|nr:hypothetical protein SD78_4297 [Bacillus badius]